MIFIKSVLRKIKNRGDITDENLDYFLVSNPRLGQIYLLPKVHKRLHNVPGRPVMSSSSYYTENISYFLDFHLKPLTQKVRSYIQNTNDFLKKIANLPPLLDSLILCTIDVVGPSPNIPHEEGLIAIRKTLDTRKDKIISIDSLIELAECVLENNIFEHDKSVFKQLRETAIQTEMAPPYVIIFMDSLEESIPSNSLVKALVWWCYIDDIFIMWEHGEEGLQKFLESLNCYHPTITFTAEYSRAKKNFLNVTVIKKGNQLVTDLFIKPTDTHQYLHASLCHFSHCKKSIPFSQVLRLNGICFENASFEKRCNGLEIWLKERGYSEKLVRGQILKARKFSRSEVLNKQKRMGNKSRIVFNITYHPVFSKFKNVLSEIHLLFTPDREHGRSLRRFL